VTATTEEIISYPLGLHDDLTLGEEYRRLQDQGPVKAQLPYGEPAWVATRYDDCRMVFTDKRFGKAYGVGRETPRMIPTRIADDGNNLAYMDTARHTRVRRLALAAFSVPQAERSRSWIQAIVDESLDAFEAAGQPSDWEAHVAWPVPLRVICNILGVVDDDIPTYRGWIDRLLSPKSSPEVKAEMQGNLLGYIRARIAERREAPTDDALSMLVSARDDNDALSEEELVKLSMNLFLAGFETTASMIGSSMWTLMQHHDVWEELVADRSLVPAALEELWRFVPTFRHGWPPVRWALEDIEMSGGVVVPAGEPVVPEVMLANRDESVFPDGWTFDIHRENPMPHLSLAYGSHRCLGAAVAMMELDLTLRTTLDRIPGLHLSVPAAEVAWSETSFMRSPSQLPLTW